MARIKIIPGINDLATTHPELAKEWDFDKNENLSPQKVSKGMHIKVWWKCKHGHSFESLIYNRVYRNDGCYYCSGKKTLTGYNDLATTHPSIAAEWSMYDNNGLSPSEVSYGTDKYKVTWKCLKCGHKWISTPNARTSNSSGCPKCKLYTHSSFGEQALYFYLEKIFHNQVKNRHYITLNNKKIECDIFIEPIRVVIEFDGYYWHKSKNTNDATKTEKLSSMGYKVIRVKEGLSNCVDNQLNVISFNWRKDYNINLTYAIQELVKLLKIDCINIDVSRDSTDILSLYKSSSLKNSLGVKFPEIANEWHPTENKNLDPFSVNSGSSINVYWLCPNCHGTYSSRISHRTGKEKSSCPYCSGQKILKGSNDFESCCPNIAKEWYYELNGSLKPSDVSKCSGKKVYWKCTTCEHIWMATVANRYHGTGCPECYKIKRKTRIK